MAICLFSDLLESGDIDGLNVVLEFADLLFHPVDADFVIFHHRGNGQLENAESDRLLLSFTPKKTFLLDRPEESGKKMALKSDVLS